MNRRFIVCLLVSMLVTGCNSIQAVEKEPLSTGTTRTYQAKYKDVVAAAKSAIPDVGLTFVTENPEGKGTLLFAQRNMTAFSYGEKVRIYIFPESPNVTVRIISEAVLATNFTAKDFTNDLFKSIEQKVIRNP